MKDTKKNNCLDGQIVCSMFESALDGIFVIDLNGRYRDVNSAGCRMFGYTKKEMLSSDIRLLLFPEDIEGAIDRVGKQVWKEGQFIPEYRMRKKDGSEIWVQMTVAPLSVNGEELVLGIKRDITENKRMAEAAFKYKNELEREIKQQTDKLTKANETLAAEVAERKLAREILNMLMQGTASLSGGEFLRSLVRQLAVTLNFRYALVGEVIGEKADKVRTLALWANGDFAENFIYDLADTPCDNVVGKSVCCYPSNVVEQFPKDKLLADMSVESYVGVPLFGTSGAPIGILVALNDKPIERGPDPCEILSFFGARASMELERKRTEKELEKSEERFKNAQQIAHIGTWDWDITDNKLYWSDEIYRIFGLIPQQFGATYEEFLNSVHPDDREFVKSSVIEALEKKKVYSIDHRIKLPEGTIKIVHEEAKVVFNSEDKPIRMMGTVQDVTEARNSEARLRESETKFRSLAENIPLGISISTEDGTFIEVNPALWKAFGYGSREEFMKLNTRALYMDPEDRDRAMEAFKNGSKEVEIKVRRKDGTEFIGLLTIIRQNKSDGKNLNFGIFQDITERKQIEAELLKSQKLESIGDLAGGIAHDFNNLLLGIIGHTSIAKRYAGGEGKLNDILGEIEKAANRAKGLTRQLLTFSKGGEPVKDAVQIGQLIKDSASLVLRGMEAKCEFSFPPELWSVEADEGQMNQVFNNIILNAEQALPGGLIEVSAENITVTSKDGLPLKNGDYVKITVSDHGAGIPYNILHKVFDPFFTTKQKASGLGLAVTYSIIKKHNGYISVSSKQGVGTYFYVYLPSALREAEVKGAEEVVNTGNGKILVMDDEELVRDVTREMLEIMGYETEFALDGREAIDKFRRAKESGKPFSAVILDLTIPGGMGGRDAMQKLLEVDPAVKAVVSSGYSKDPIMSDFRKYGFSGVISKPYRVSDFSRVITSVISGKGQKD